MDDTAVLPKRLEEIVADFELCEGREKLELLLEYAMNFPTFPERLQRPGAVEEVPECMTPVQMTAEQKDGQLFFYFDVPAESPTVRGFAALVMDGINGLKPADVLAIPADFYLRMGLQEVLTAQRMNGMSAILAHVKRRALKAIEES
jgi:cysteine desulfuration protein SufE